MNGLIHIYHGDGKGKTTAAIGLSIRALGRQMHVYFLRFMKNNDSGELAILGQLEGITLPPLTKTFGFYRTLSDSEKQDAKEYYSALFDRAAEETSDGSYGLLVLDEILDACRYDLVALSSLCLFLKQKPESLEVVLTGRNPDPSLLDAADYISYIKKERHPYDNGIAARIGIEK